MSEQRSDQPVRPGESSAQRYDRNWVDILQELRVTQTGNQILTGFLLALAFQQRFAELDRLGIVIYLVLVGLAGAATVLALTPVTLHRWLFQHHAKREAVLIGNRILRATLIAVGLLIIGVTVFVFSFVVSLRAGLVAGLVVLAAVVVLWLWLPLDVLRRERGGDGWWA
jgi:hypothetical protein